MRILLMILGSVALVLGVVGVFLPLLPTTPFLLLAAALYFRSSPRLYDWLLSHPYLGEYIRNFRENRAIPLRVKIISVTFLWVTLLYCTFFVAYNIYMRLFFVALAVGVTVHILRYKTLKK
ncbi:MAG: DUF454 domain-containing protein [Bacteroidales bacterium]|nr:DUF454 domain-containing protein [Bacteroidales bacterium]